MDLSNPPTLLQAQNVKYALWALSHFPGLRAPSRRYLAALTYWTSEHAWQLSALSLMQAQVVMAQYQWRPSPLVSAAIWHAADKLWDNVDIPTKVYLSFIPRLILRFPSFSTSIASLT